MQVGIKEISKNPPRQSRIFCVCWGVKGDLVNDSADTDVTVRRSSTTRNLFCLPFFL